MHGASDGCVKEANVGDADAGSGSQSCVAFIDPGGTTCGIAGSSVDHGIAT